MKKLKACILVLIMVMNMSIFAFAENETTTEETYATGLIPITEEELEVLENSIPQIIDVKPNALFYERLQAEYSESFSAENIMQPIAEYGEEIVSSLEDTSVQPLSNEEMLLPTAVDNSALDNNGNSTFPTIGNQGDLNACAGWSFGYYQLTNNANRIRGTAARNSTGNIAENVYSPNWVYNLGSNGTNNGMNVLQAMNVLYTYGCPTTDLIPINTDKTNATNYRTWYPEANIWESALYNKCDLYSGLISDGDIETPIESVNSEALKNIKLLLADGYVVSFGTNVYNTPTNLQKIIKTGYNSKNEACVTWTEFRSDGEGHALTIVGYDDYFKVDINGNDTYENGEYGAFKVANSWGSNADYHNEGYFWMPYDALNKTSAVKETQHSRRISALNGYKFYLILPLEEYQPLLLGEVEIQANSRRSLTINIGVYDIEDMDECCEQGITYALYTDGRIVNEDDEIAFKNSMGNYTFDADGSYLGTFMFDFTSILKNFEIKQNREYVLYMRIDDPLKKGAKIQSFKLHDMYTGKIYETSESMIENVEGQAYAEVAYMSSVLTIEPENRVTVVFNNNVAENSANNTNVLISNSNNNLININISISRNNNTKLYLDATDDYTSDFYKITILPELTSVGGNRLKGIFEKIFYVPFH